MIEKPECRILQVFGTLGTGGAETWLIALLKYFKENQEAFPFRLSVHIFLTNDVKSVFDDEAELLGATLHYSKYTRSNLIGFIRDWRRVLRDYNFHVIHDHQEHTSGLHFLMGLGHLPKIKIAHVHNPLLSLRIYSSSFIRKSTVRFGQILVALFGTHILGTSKQLIIEQGYFRPLFSRLVREPVYCGFDTSKFSGDHSEQFRLLSQEFNWPTSSKILLFVGRLNSSENEDINQKNPAFALEVAKICAEKDPSFRFLMVGGGEPVLNRLTEQVARWGLDEQIKLTGRRADIPRIMIGSHLFILPSLAEGLGMVVVEAQAAGLMSLVSDVTPRECSVDDTKVQFISLEDGKEFWASKVLDLMKTPRTNEGESNAAVRSSEFSIVNSAAKLIKIYTKNIRT